MTSNSIEFEDTEIDTVELICTVEEDGIIITGCSEFNGGLIIPSIIDGKPVIAISALRVWGLTDLTLPDSLTAIEEGAFFGCFNLRSIAIPDSVASIGKSAFFGCVSLTSIIIPDSVTSIGIGVFLIVTCLPA